MCAVQSKGSGSGQEGGCLPLVSPRPRINELNKDVFDFVPGIYSGALECPPFKCEVFWPDVGNRPSVPQAGGIKT